jgi:hypothetical protein
MRIAFGIVALIVLTVSLGHVCVVEGQARGAPSSDRALTAPAPGHHEHRHLPSALCLPPPVTVSASLAHGGPPLAGQTVDDAATVFLVATRSAGARPLSDCCRQASPLLFLLHRSLLI